MHELTFYIKAFITLLVLVNPLEGIPVFLAGTERVEPSMRQAISRRTAIAVTIILLISLFLGKALLAMFSISSSAFQIGGGAILFLIAVQMILGPGGGATFSKMAGGEVNLQFAIVPLAIPILAGPGAINGAVLYGTRTTGLWQMLLLAGVIVLVGVGAYACLRAAEPLAKYLKDSGISIATRIMGLIIAAISVEMILQGIASVFGLKLLEQVSSM
ncbi:MAG TPA: MarC family protein [Phycisphaerae bacterium]|nr:MarC family protein [Phycisphaerae bacterium]HPS52996.1 MarC family protein [Phycisphaerae bacterium]